MQEQIVYLIGNAFRVYIYWKLLNTIFCAAKVKQFWIYNWIYALFSTQ